MSAMSPTVAGFVTPEFQFLSGHAGYFVVSTHLFTAGKESPALPQSPNAVTSLSPPYVPCHPLMSPPVLTPPHTLEGTLRGAGRGRKRPAWSRPRTTTEWGEVGWGVEPLTISQPSSSHVRARPHPFSLKTALPKAGSQHRQGKGPGTGDGNFQPMPRLHGSPTG